MILQCSFQCLSFAFPNITCTLGYRKATKNVAATTTPHRSANALQIPKHETLSPALGILFCVWQVGP